MTQDRAHTIYTVLVAMVGASAEDRDNFVYHHSKSGCEEWRFGGKLGFGGKYYSRENVVSCYKEDETTERMKLIGQTNTALAGITVE
jgi:hypothetical protein